ncbi:MAG: preprotein translocase subunit SecE [Moheibacter sp.]
MKFIDYAKDSFNEFRHHVTWPSWATLQQDTVIVSVVTALLAVFLYGVDSFFGNLIIKNLFEFLR